jgi:dTDP-4-dehydrorhamnose reductase
VGQYSRLVVTGANGQLGRALGGLATGATLLGKEALDLTDSAEVRRVLGDLAPQVIIHGAAYTAVDAAEADRQGAWAVNVEGTRAVAAAAARLGALVVYVSTDYVFSGTCREPYTEDQATGALSVYGNTKLEGERVVAGLERHLIVRTSWVFGDGRNFVRAILGAARAHPGRQLTVVDDQRGRPTYAPDLAQGLLRLLRCGARGTFHLQGGGEPGTWADVAEVALAAAGLVCPVRRVTTAAYDEGRPGPIARRPANGVLDCTRAAALGVELRDWRQAVAAYVKVVR